MDPNSYFFFFWKKGFRAENGNASYFTVNRNLKQLNTHKIVEKSRVSEIFVVVVIFHCTANCKQRSRKLLLPSTNEEKH